MKNIRFPRFFYGEISDSPENFYGKIYDSPEILCVLRGIFYAKITPKKAKNSRMMLLF